MNQLIRRRIVTLLAGLLLLFMLVACASASANTQSMPTSNNNAATSTPADLPQTGSDATQAATNTSTTRLNLNTASAQDFLTIPGLASRMVKEFQEYRPYTSILQFRKEIGKYVSADQVAEYEKYVYVPISVNDSDTATLQQIPGLDATETAALIAARPYASTDAFLAKLAQYVAADQFAIAKTYLSNQ